MLLEEHADFIISGWGLLGQSLTKIAHSMGQRVQVVSASASESPPSAWTSSSWLQDQIHRASKEARCIIHTAAMTNVLQCELQPEAAMATNVKATETLARLAVERGLHLCFISTDWVFDGRVGNYNESATKCPINIYGETKAAAEEIALAADGLVIRGSFIGARPDGKVGLREVLNGASTPRVGRQRLSNPLHVDTFARKVLELALSEVDGVAHLGSATPTNWTSLCREARRRMTGDESILRAPDDEVSRPYDTSLASERVSWTEGQPTLEDTIAAFCSQPSVTHHGEELIH